MAQQQPGQARRKRQPVGRIAVVAMALGLIPLWTGGANVPNPDVGSQPVELAVRRPRVVILKAHRLLHLLDEDRVVRSYPIDLGTHPIGIKRQSGDGRTPEGRFQICVKRADSPHHRFLGIDYPNDPAVVVGLAAGLLSTGEAAGVRRALQAGRCPDWGTALGGGIGIHGRARGEDWTAGCIAVSDAGVEELFAVLRIGDSVEILP